jgi:malonyl CoA-acyl carrier protein transacylase
MNTLNPKIMYIFPGQGSQYKGMGSDLYDEFEAARKVYREAEEALGYDVAELSFRDPENKLNSTIYTQPAILTHSIACLEVFNELTDGNVQAKVGGGHSLGEYSALVAAGVIPLREALVLVHRRGELLSEYGRGLMAALPLDAVTLKAIVPKFYCEIGGCNVPDQTVVGGAKQDLDALTDYLKEHYNTRATLLNVEGAFHTYLMVTAAEKFRPDLDRARFAKPKFEVLSNYTGKYHPADTYGIKASLFFQIFNPVRWIWGMHHALNDGVNLIFEFGGGIGKGERPADKRPNLAGITKKALRSAGRHGLYVPAINCETLKKAASLIRSLQAIGGPDIEYAGHEAARQAGSGLILYIPLVDNIVTESSLTLLEDIGDMGLNGDVMLVGQPADRNLSDLKAFAMRDAGTAQPYLVDTTANGRDTDSYYVGAAIQERLRGLAHRAGRA